MRLLYAIIATDAPDSLERRKAARAEHQQRLRLLQGEGRLLTAGPFPAADAPDLNAGASGSLIVAEFASLEAARAWAEADPYRRDGIYADIVVKPFLKVFPE